MIKHIWLTKIDSFESLQLDFSPQTNVIVGPKGGGKSTLFNLLAGLDSKYISKNTIKALDSFGLAFEKAELYTGEFIYLNNIEQKIIKKNIDEYENRNNVISQNDPIKTRLDDNKQVYKSLKNWTMQVVSGSESTNRLLGKLEQFYTRIITFSNFILENKINWTNTHMIKGSAKSKLNVFVPLDSLVVLSEFKQIKTKVEDANKKLQLYSDSIKSTLNLGIKKDLDKYFSNGFLENTDKIKKEIIDNISKLYISQEKEIAKLDKDYMIIQMFYSSYKNLLNKIAGESKEKNVLSQFHSQAREHFKSIARQIRLVEEAFNHLISNDYILNFENITGTDGVLNYKVSNEIKFSADEIVKLISCALYKPSKSTNDAIAWLEEINKRGIKNNFDNEKLKEEITKIIIKNEDSAIMAEGKVYQTLSLGEKSIFGIQHKISKSKENNLFVDQIEDNLDNNTIATRITDMLNSKTGQKFIVTHNANIGILTNVEEVIVADKDSKNSEPYSKGFISQQQEIKKGSDLAYYLEGGIVSVEKRLRILKGE